LFFFIDTDVELHIRSLLFWTEWGWCGHKSISLTHLTTLVQTSMMFLLRDE